MPIQEVTGPARPLGISNSPTVKLLRSYHHHPSSRLSCLRPYFSRNSSSIFTTHSICFLDISPSDLVFPRLLAFTAPANTTYILRQPTHSFSESITLFQWRLTDLLTVSKYQASISFLMYSSCIRSCSTSSSNPLLLAIPFLYDFLRAPLHHTCCRALASLASIPCFPRSDRRP